MKKYIIILALNGKGLTICGYSTKILEYTGIAKPTYNDIQILINQLFSADLVDHIISVSEYGVGELTGELLSTYNDVISLLGLHENVSYDSLPKYINLKTLQEIKTILENNYNTFISEPN